MFRAWGGRETRSQASPNKMPDGSSKIDYMKKLGADEAGCVVEGLWWGEGGGGGQSKARDIVHDICSRTCLISVFGLYIDRV